MLLWWKYWDQIVQWFERPSSKGAGLVIASHRLLAPITGDSDATENHLLDFIISWLLPETRHNANAYIKQLCFLSLDFPLSFDPSGYVKVSRLQTSQSLLWICNRSLCKTWPWGLGLINPCWFDDRWSSALCIYSKCGRLRNILGGATTFIWLDKLQNTSYGN